MKGTEVSPPLQRSPGRAGISAALKARVRAPSLHAWAAGLGCLQALGTLFFHGTGQDVPPASLDAGCHNPNCGNCGGRVRDFPVSLSQIISWKHSPGWLQPLDTALQEKQAGVDGGGGAAVSAHCCQNRVPRARHIAWGSLLEHWPSGTPRLPLVFCPGHSQPPLIPGPVPSVAFWQSKFISSFTYERSSCFPWQPF